VRSSTVEAIPTLLYGIEVSYYSLIVCGMECAQSEPTGAHGRDIQREQKGLFKSWQYILIFTFKWYILPRYQKLS
jgi:hypothetical protein